MRLIVHVEKSQNGSFFDRVSACVFKRVQNNTICKTVARPVLRIAIATFVARAIVAKSDDEIVSESSATIAFVVFPRNFLQPIDR